MEIETKKNGRDEQECETLFEELSIVEVEERLVFALGGRCCSEDVDHIDD